MHERVKKIAIVTASIGAMVAVAGAPITSSIFQQTGYVAASAVEEIKSGYPLLVATKLKDLDLLPNINGYIKAHNTKIEILSAEDLALDSNKIGLKGSPTKVKTAFRPNYQKNTLVIDNQSNADCADFILGEIEKCRINNEQ